MNAGKREECKQKGEVGGEVKRKREAVKGKNGEKKRGKRDWGGDKEWGNTRRRRGNIWVEIEKGLERSLKKRGGVEEGEEE